MTPIRRRSFLAGSCAALLCAGCASGTPGVSAEASPRRPEPTVPWVAPVWRIGDRWVYEWTSGSESGTKTVEVSDAREMNGVAYYVVRLGDAEHYYTRDLHWAAAVREGRVEARMVPPQPWFVWPLTPGHRWTHQGRFEQRESAVRHDDRFAVVGLEPVEVPAGRYQAVKVVRETDRQDSDAYWYAPDVRWHVRWTGRRGEVQFEERLREFHASKPASG